MNYEMLVGSLKSIFTRDNVTFVLALMGAVGSFYTFIMQRKKIRITIQRFTYNDGILLMYLSYVNLSHLSVSITNVNLIYKGISYPCAYEPTLAQTYTHKIGKEIVTRRDDFTTALPLNLSALAGSSGYIYFGSLPSDFSEHSGTIEIEVGTNRGRAIKMKLKIPDKE